MPSISRRSFLRNSTTGLLSVASSLAALPLVRRISAEEVPSFSFAHLTDMHVQSELGAAAAGFRQCIAKLNQLRARPDFVITGGNLIMDALAVDEVRLKEQVKLFDECCQDFDLPVHHVVGNHDVVGWSTQANVLSDHALFGKRLFADQYGSGRTYRSFDHKGWHFILLDSIGQSPGSPEYIGLIDEVQMDWLKQDLAAVGRTKPIVIVTHIPFFSVWNQAILGPTAPVGPKSLVTNVPEVRKLLAGFNVNLVLSGHGHIRERIELGRTTHIQSGSVSGRWWKGPINGDAEAFAVITLNGGDFAYRYEEFGWKPRTP